MTAKPLKFILNSDYASLKNDSITNTITLNVPATTITAGNSKTYSSEYTVGVSGAPMDFDINYSMTTQRFIGSMMTAVEINGNSTYQISIMIFRSSATNIKVKANLFYGGPNASVTTNARTITVRTRTFIPPFA